MAGRIIFYPYKMGSKSCSDIVKRLRENNVQRKILRVHPSRNFHSFSRDTLVNWGNSTIPSWDMRSILNRPENVKVAANKLLTFRALQAAGISIVPYTDSPFDATNWLVEDHIVVSRMKLSGHSGDGIVISRLDDEHDDEIPTAQLYTRFMKKSVEYRVHVFRGEVIDYTKKVKRVRCDSCLAGFSREDILSNCTCSLRSRVKDDFVRSNTLGWELIRDVAPRDSVKQLAIDAVAALGLDFGSVDIIRSNRVNYVLEVGTAPGLSPYGVQRYCEAIQSLLAVNR
jgi:hypothetical protein